jgi:hypothetical protein
MADPLPSDGFMRAILGEVFMVQRDGVYADSGDGANKISAELTREQVAAEPCKCVRCVMCSGTGRVRVDHWSGYDTEPCEDCENGITEPCGRCEYLADLDRELF